MLGVDVRDAPTAIFPDIAETSGHVLPARPRFSGGAAQSICPHRPPQPDTPARPGRVTPVGSFRRRPRETTRIGGGRRRLSLSVAGILDRSRGLGDGAQQAVQLRCACARAGCDVGTDPALLDVGTVGQSDPVTDVRTGQSPCHPSTGVGEPPRILAPDDQCARFRFRPDDDATCIRG